MVELPAELAGLPGGKLAEDAARQLVRRARERQDRHVRIHLLQEPGEVGRFEALQVVEMDLGQGADSRGALVFRRGVCGCGS